MDSREIDQKIQTLLCPWDESRCRICGWPLEADVPEQCHVGNCSLRPAPKKRADAPASYSDSLDLAMGAYEEFRKMRGWRLAGLVQYEANRPSVPNCWYCRLVKDMPVSPIAEGQCVTPAEAICEAILAAAKWDTEVAGLSDVSVVTEAGTDKKEAPNLMTLEGK